MRAKSVFAISVIVMFFAGVVYADSWTISTHYLRIDGAEPGGSSDNVGAMVSYDWLLSPNQTFAVEAFGSWDNPIDLYGGGLNTKFHMSPWGEFDIYAGLYGNYAYAASLPSGFSDEHGFMYGPLAGVRMPVNDSTQLFFEYRYSFIDRSQFREIIDEANWFIFGLEFSF